jgi:hypothetical protein
MTELLGISHHEVLLGIAQAAAAVVLCLAVVFLCRRFAVHVERETVVSLDRWLPWARSWQRCCTEVWP